MSLLNTLPDDIIHKIYRYINPIFDYTNYVENMKNFHTITENVSTMYNDFYNSDVVHHRDIHQNLLFVSVAAQMTNLQLKCLQKINEFIKQNPKLERPANYEDLDQYQYKKCLETHIHYSQMPRLEENINVRRGIWFKPNTNEELMVVHDIVNTLQYGTVSELIYACIVNNVKGFKTALRDYTLKKLFVNIDIQPLQDKHIISFANYYYNENAILSYSRDDLKKVPHKSKLIKRLMEL